jgi:hypothetical protein
MKRAGLLSPSSHADGDFAEGRFQVATISTELNPPYGFRTVSFAFGSGTHWPSTTNRYSCRPGLTLKAPTHFPPGTGSRGVFPGSHPLNEPATETDFASGFVNSSNTPPAANADIALEVRSGLTGAAGDKGCSITDTGLTAGFLTIRALDNLGSFLVFIIAPRLATGVPLLNDTVERRWNSRKQQPFCGTPSNTLRIQVIRFSQRG